MDTNNYMECCSLLTQKLHFIISVESGSYAIETISAQSMGSKRQFLCQKKSGIIGKWYLFFSFERSIVAVEIWEKACWGSEQRERRREGRSSKDPAYPCQAVFVVNSMWCANIPPLDIFASFFTWERFGMRDTTFWISFKVIYRQSQDSNPDLTIVKPKFLLWICQQKQGSSCQGIEPLYIA